jgi:uncharacterized Ntn-hydrolase superfamily protein
VLRASVGVGISASQGRFPSTLWGIQVLDEMQRGLDPKSAIEWTIGPDEGRESRQLLALDALGQGAAYTGAENMPEASEVILPDICAGGNMLSNADVVEASIKGYANCEGPLLHKLRHGLEAAAQAGGDTRGLMSAAILIVSEDQPPVDLRVDYSEDAIGALSDLIVLIEKPHYANWVRELPTKTKPFPSR